MWRKFWRKKGGQPADLQNGERWTIDWLTSLYIYIYIYIFFYLYLYVVFTYFFCWSPLVFCSFSSLFSMWLLFLPLLLLGCFCLTCVCVCVSLLCLLIFCPSSLCSTTSPVVNICLFCLGFFLVYLFIFVLCLCLCVLSTSISRFQIFVCLEMLKVNSRSTTSKLAFELVYLKVPS